MSADAIHVPTISHRNITVDIREPVHPVEQPVNLNTRTPSIHLYIDHQFAGGLTKLTWREARALAKALIAITDLAEYG